MKDLMIELRMGCYKMMNRKIKHNIIQIQRLAIKMKVESKYYIRIL